MAPIVVSSDVEPGTTATVERLENLIAGDVSFFQLRMSEIDDVELLDKRGYLTICVSLVKDGKVYLRKTEGIREWFRAIRVRSGEINTFHRFSLNYSST